MNHTNQGGAPLPAAPQVPQQQHQQTINPQLLSLTQTLKRGNGPDQDDMVYRAVSPHGHVYWEIDPTQNYVIINNQQDDERTPLNGYNMNNREGSSRFCSEQRPLISSPMHPPNQGSSTATTSSGGSASSNELLMRASSSMDFGAGRNGSTPVTPHGVTSSFVRTGANRFNRSRMTLDRNRSHDDSSQSGGGINPSSGAGQTNVPEQLQQQVQIRDCKPIQVSVKSSEYIEAKIRTLRKNNNNTSSSQMHH